MRDFKENELIIYQNGDRFEIGRIKRLTEDGAFVYYHSGDTASKTPFDCMHKLINNYCIVKTTLGGETFRQRVKWLEELKEYKHLEEQGLLLKLPVSLGQEVYRVNNIIIPMTVTEISYSLSFRNKPRLMIQTEEKEYRGHNYFRVENIGKTVFLTKEEAEQELKRLEGAE